MQYILIRSIMRTNQFILLYFFILILFVSCNTKQNETQTLRLAALDSLLDTQPETALDSLNSIIQSDKLSRFNTAYADLLQTIAQDKTYFNFTSDSLISNTVEILSSYKDNHPELYARSLLYQGLVRYRMGVTDSTAYQPIKIATDILKETKTIKTNSTVLMCFMYLGEIHNSNDNNKLAYKWYKEAYIVAKSLGKEDDIYFATYALFWNKLVQRDLDSAEYYLNELADNLKINTEYKYSLKNDSASLFLQKGDYQDALRLNLEELEQLNPADTFALRAVHYSLADIYLRLAKPLSAYRHAKQAVSLIQDTLYAYNDLYYKKLGESAFEANLYKEAYAASRKAYKHHLNFIDKKTDKQILELEKKYDYAEEKNKALIYRNRLLLSLGVVGFLIILLIFGTVIWRIKKRQSDRKLQLATAKVLNIELEKKNKEMENQYLIKVQKQSERELALTNYLLLQYQRKFRQHTSMKNFIADLTAIPVIAKNKLIQKKILEMQDITKEDNSAQIEESTKTLVRTLDIDEQVINHLEPSELELLITLSLIPNTRQAADLLETTTNSLYVRKSNLKKKLQTFHVELSETFR